MSCPENTAIPLFPSLLLHRGFMSSGETPLTVWQQSSSGKQLLNNHSYVTGGNGFEEYFGPENKFRDRLGAGTTESCNVYNMLKLSEHLFEWEPTARVADYYERALFNHILSSQNPETGNVTYNLSLAMGGFKDFQDPYDFTCCIGTGMENHSKYGKNIFYHNE